MTMPCASGRVAARLRTSRASSTQSRQAMPVLATDRKDTTSSSTPSSSGANSPTTSSTERTRPLSPYSTQSYGERPTMAIVPPAPTTKTRRSVEREEAGFASVTRLHRECVFEPHFARTHHGPGQISDAGDLVSFAIISHAIDHFEHGSGAQ